MELDDTVCRGSLVLYQGEWYVLIRRVGPTSNHNRLEHLRQWWAFAVKNIDEGFYNEYQIFYMNTEVEMFFPGEAYPVPKYIT